MPKKYQNIPTNIITGFLGVGKTTLIRKLLQQKPPQQRWAVLVNEFGEVGIDGALMNADGIAVKEVAGGCMCCAVGLPSRTALNRLIRQHNPHRIIIEPTGLAHPKQVLQMFGGSEYQGVLDIRAVICLIDPWSLTQEKFLQLPAFLDQVQMADVLVATKADMATPEQLLRFSQFAENFQPKKQLIEQISDGNLPWQCLDLQHEHEHEHEHERDRGEVIVAASTSHSGHHHSDITANQSVTQCDDDGVVRSESATEFAFSCGWIFPAQQRFDFDKLCACIRAIPAPRVKGIFYSNQGWYVINRMRDVVSTQAIAPADDSRIEMIDTQKNDWLLIDQQLRQCRI